MKPREGSIPALDDDRFDLEDTGGRPRSIGVAMETAEVDVSRDQRVTLTSPIPARLAEEMLSGPLGGSPWDARDPAAPWTEEDHHTRRVGDEEEQHTRRVGDSDRQSFGSGSKPTASAEAGIAPRRQRAAAL
ncbi:MAG TPA: hypothetical protein VKO16_11070, partial [Polyangia bacterium]|nr:hypothetical protein [Polyangia bacterium]